MLKRLFQASLSTPTYPSPGCEDNANYPQPIKAADKQRLVKLSNPQDKVQVSHWSAQGQMSTYAAIHHYTQPNSPEDISPIGKHSDHLDASAPMLNRAAAKIDHLHQQVQRQQQLRQVEQKLSQTLNFSTIAGTTVVETAALFNAKQVNLLRYDETAGTCQQVVRYCQNQTLAWQPAFNITATEFPMLLQQLWQGKMLKILPGQARAVDTGVTGNRAPESQTSGHPINQQPSAPETVSAGTNEHPNELPALETQQWLNRWPGSWLLIPVSKGQNGQTTQPLLPNSDQPTGPNTTEPNTTNYWGFMALALSERASWTHEAATAASNIVISFTAAMQRAQQYHELMVANKELQKLALSDGLTCLANRRRFDEHLADEWQRLARDKKPLSLILCDLDHFKRYNDTFGHPAGDRCLIRVARALLNGPQRPADLVARYGGEEFAIILPNTDTHGAWRIAQKIHESIRALQIDHAPDNENPYVTVTMGVSTVIPGHDNTAQMLVQASDLALYHAKQQGRNRTYVNGHYNTVSEEQVTGSHPEDPSQLDLMPLDAGE